MAKNGRLIDNGDGTCDIVGMTIWTSGKFRGYGSPKNGDEYTPKDLNQMARSHDELALGPRLYYGHPLNPTLSLLAKPKGDIENLRVAGSKLIADFNNVPLETAQEAIKDNVRFSPDMKMNYLDPQTGKSHKWVITGVAMLGAVAPGNKLIPGMGDQLQMSPDKYYVEELSRSYAAKGERSFTLDFSGRFIAADPDVAPFLQRMNREKNRRIHAQSRSFALGGNNDRFFSAIEDILR